MMIWKQGLLLLACFAVAISAQGSKAWPSGQAQAIQPMTNSSLEVLRSISSGAEDFSLRFFAKVSNVLSDPKIHKSNFMISPFSVWALLLLITEGAAENTLKELQTTLRLTNNSQVLRQGYQTIERALKVNTSTIEVSTMQTIFYDMNRPLKQDYEYVIEQEYLANLKPINFFDQARAQMEITKYIEEATRGFIKPSFQQSDFEDAQMLMISSIYFKGQWKLPFNSSFTKEEPFYNEDNEVVAQVQMMTQTALFNYAPIIELQSHVLELPYGQEDRLSMFIIIPKKGNRLVDTINKLQNVGLELIFNELKKKEQLTAEYDSDEVEVFLPKFVTSTSIVLNAVLEEMGILDVFQPVYANLTKISDQPLYVSRVIHQTKIEVNEEGTVAAAFTAGTFANKASPPRFYLNRPFAYLIVEKTTRALLFCGQVTKPVYRK